MKKLVLATGKAISRRRRRRRRLDGRLSRPVRCIVLRTQYVEMHSLVGQLVDKRAPSVTSGVKWVSKAFNIQVLDTPVTIPVRADDLHVALCDDVASSDSVLFLPRG